MKFRKQIVTVLLIATIFTISGCKNKDKDTLSSDLKNSEQTNAINNLLKTPNKINMYADGKQKQITKSGDMYEQTLFERIKFLIDIKIPPEFSVSKGIYTETDIKDVKAYSVEFVYDKPQTVTINNGNKTQVEFTNIYFPLGDKWQNTAFIMTKDNQYTLVGLKENLDYLIKASVKQ